jgi:hypothetical protein
LPSWLGTLGELIVGEVGMVVCVLSAVPTTAFWEFASLARSLPTAANPVVGTAINVIITLNA